MATIKCNKCGSEADATATQCPACGAPLAASQVAQTSPAGAMGKYIATVIVLIGIALFAYWWFFSRASQHGGSMSETKAPEKIDLAAVKAKAEQGDAQAQYEFGRAYAKGLGVNQSYDEAAKWYLKAAEKGNPQAQVAIGELAEAGQGVPQDEAETAKWYRKAADQGYAAAQYNLAVLYLMGKGVPRSVAEALKLYRKAADQGDALSQFNLGMRYLEGNGVTADPVEAYTWLSLASSQGIGDATKAVAGLKSRMSREQLAEAQKRVAAFVPKKSDTMNK